MDNPESCAKWFLNESSLPAQLLPNLQKLLQTNDALEFEVSALDHHQGSSVTGYAVNKGTKERLSAEDSEVLEYDVFSMVWDSILSSMVFSWATDCLIHITTVDGKIELTSTFERDWTFSSDLDDHHLKIEGLEDYAKQELRDSYPNVDLEYCDALFDIDFFLENGNVIKCTSVVTFDNPENEPIVHKEEGFDHLTQRFLLGELQVLIKDIEASSETYWVSIKASNAPVEDFDLTCGCSFTERL